VGYLTTNTSTGTFILPHLFVVSTLRISFARFQSPLRLDIRTLVFASRSVTLVRPCRFPNPSLCKRLSPQTARMLRISSYTVNFPI